MKHYSEIVELIESVCATVPIDKRDPITKALKGPLWKDTEQAPKILEIIKNETSFEIFDNHLQELGFSSIIVTIDQLIDWIIQKSYIVGPKQAINYLIDYVKSDSVEVDFVELIIETLAENEFEFCNGVKLTSPHNLRNSYYANLFVSESYYSRTPLPKISMVLIKPYNQPIHHFKSDGSASKFLKTEPPREDLNDVMLCLSLARQPEYGVFSVAQTTIAPDKYPFIHSCSGYNLKAFKIPKLQSSILNIEMNIANNILEKFIQLPPDFKSHLKIPLGKLNDFGSSMDSIGQAIDLRICLEAIFLNDGNKEQLSYRLALRAALFLADDLTDRQRIFKQIKDTYDLTSSAVHNGKFSKKADFSLLEKSAILAKQAIVKLINHGQINWEELELKN